MLLQPPCLTAVQVSVNLESSRRAYSHLKPDSVEVLRVQVIGARLYVMHSEADLVNVPVHAPGPFAEFPTDPASPLQVPRFAYRHATVGDARKMVLIHHSAGPFFSQDCFTKSDIWKWSGDAHFRSKSEANIPSRWSHPPAFDGVTTARQHSLPFTSIRTVTCSSSTSSMSHTWLACRAAIPL